MNSVHSHVLRTTWGFYFIFLWCSFYSTLKGFQVITQVYFLRDLQDTLSFDLLCIWGFRFWGFVFFSPFGVFNFLFYSESVFLVCLLLFPALVIVCTCPDVSPLCSRPLPPHSLLCLSRSGRLFCSQFHFVSPEFFSKTVTEALMGHYRCLHDIPGSLFRQLHYTTSA